MALIKIPIDQGAFKNVDPFEGGDLGHAAELKNMLINDAGTNVSRPGLLNFSTLGDGSSPVTGLATFMNKLVAVTEDRSIYQISTTGASLDITGTALEAGSRPIFDNDGTYLAIAGGGAPKRWIGSGDTELMPGSPEDCTHINYLDGYWILHLINDQEFRWAGPTSAARDAWNTANFFSAEGLPDKVRSQAVLLREFYSFGDESTEIFFNYGDSSVPFKRTFFIDTGIGAPRSVVKADNTLWWFDNRRRIVKLEGRTPTFISTPYDKVFRQLNVVGDCFGSVIDIDGFYLIVWTFPSEERVFVFDYKKNYWSEWDGFVNGQTSSMEFNSYVGYQNRHYVGSRTEGKVYELKFDAKTDVGDTLRCIRRTGSITHGTQARKRSNYYLMNVEMGMGAQGGVEPKMQVRVKDDGNPWSPPVFIDLGNIGDPQEPIRIDLRGIYRRRQLEVSVTDAVSFKINSIEEEVEGISV